MKIIISCFLKVTLVICILFASNGPSFAFKPVVKDFNHGQIMPPKLRKTGKKRLKKREISPGKLKSRKDPGTITWSKITGGPRHIRGDITPPSREDPETIALRFLEEKKELYDIEDPQKDLYKIKSVVNKWTHYTTIHLGQRHKGIPVENRLIISVSPKGMISSIHGIYYSDLEVDITPNISAQKAQKIAERHVRKYYKDLGIPGEELSGPIKISKPELLIWPTGNKDYLLWHFYADRWAYLVDAHTGAIRGAISTFYSVSGFVDATGYVLQPPITNPDEVVNFRLYYDESNQSYLSKDDVSTGLNEDPNTILILTYEYWPPNEIKNSDTPNVPSDPNGNDIWVSAHYYTGITTKFYQEILERNGYDDEGTVMHVLINAKGWDHNSQTYTGDWGWCTGWGINLGYGAPGIRRNYAGSLDTIAHEFSHAVTIAERGQVEMKGNETLSLYESFSDMMACAVEYWLDTTVEKFNGTFDWLIGEDITILDPVSGKAYSRNLSDPTDTNQPDTYPNGDPNNSSEGGWIPLHDPDYLPHINGGVPNKMFYLLSEGGMHNGVHVKEIGILDAAKLMYSANKDKWGASSTFLEARDDCIDAAQEWDANHPTKWAPSVQNAWAAVNVGNPIGDNYEPDGSKEYAKPIAFDVQQTHSISPETDHDWMRFTLESTKIVQIETSGPSEDDTVMWLKDEAGNQIEFDDDGGEGLFSKIIRELDVGTYYIEIEESDNNDEIASYTISLSFIPTSDRFDETTPILSSGSYGGSITFNFNNVLTNPTSDGTLTISAEGDLNSPSEYITVYAEDSNDINLGVVFNTIGPTQCGGFNEAQIVISKANMQSIAADGQITFILVASSGVDYGCDFRASLRLEYEGTNDEPSPPLLFFDDMESGVGEWTATGLWHQIPSSSCISPGYSSATTSWYYGQDAGL
jgi:Zn-dependent metalloprotease